MTTGATGQLGLALPVQGELSGTWGDTVNNGITQYTNIAIAGTLTLTGDGAVTLANTTGDASASNITSTLAGAGTVTAQFAIVKVSGTTTTKVVTGPSYSKTYVVDNASSYAVTFKASGQTGVSVAAAEKVTVVFNGTDYIKLAGTIANAAGSNTQIQFNNGGLFGASANLTWDGTTLSSTQVNITGQGTLRLQDTTGGEYVGLRSPSALGASYTLTFPADDGTSGQALITDGSGGLSWSTAASGDVYGPASSTDKAIVRFDSTTGKLIQNSVGILSDAGILTGLTGITSSGSITFSSLTAGRVTYAGTSGLLQDSDNLTFSGTTLTLKTGYYEAYDPTDATSAGVGMRFFTNGGGTKTENGRLVVSQTSTGSALSSMIFQTNNGSSLAEQMRLTSTGLGIGTSSPSVKLDVKGGNANQAIFNNAGEQYTQVNWQNNGTNKGAIWVNNTTSLFELYGYSGVGMTFSTNATERMRLDSAGNLGLGVTPNAGTSGKVFQITDAGHFMASGSTVYIDANAYFDSGWKYITSAAASNYYQSSGAHIWQTAASGTAGNAISFTQAMTLDASGNLGVGTTSPVGRFSVAGGESNFTSLSTVSGTSRVNIGADATNAFVRSYDSSGGLIFGTINATPIKIFTNGGEVARFDSSGRFGIGTSSPSYRLDLGSTGNVQFFGSTNGIDANFGMVFSTNTVTLQNTGGSGVIAFATNSSERARIDSSGNFMVGSTSTSAIANKNIDVNGTGDAAFVVRVGGTSYAYLYSTAGQATVGTTTTIPLSFSTNNAERARITSTGNFYVGATTNLNGNNVQFSTGSGASSSPYVAILNTATTPTSSASTRLDLGFHSGASNYVATGTILGQVNFIGQANDDGYGGAYMVAEVTSGGNVGRASGHSVDLRFGTKSSSSTGTAEVARFTGSGNLLIGKTSGGGTTKGIQLEQNGTAIFTTDSNAVDPLSYFVNSNASVTNGFRYVSFRAGSGFAEVGTITTNGSSTTAYNTSSDYRLKNTISPMTGALSKVALLKPCTYKWNVDGSDGEGFIAHELAEVCPNAVTGAKDAVDADGNPKYQGIDVSFLVATLTAAIQEQQTIIESLKARLDSANL